MRDFPEDGGPEIRRFNFPLYGEDFLSAQRGSRSKEVEEKDRGPLRCARLFLGLFSELRHELIHHLFEFLALPGLQDLDDPGSAGRAQVIQLVLEALVVMAIIFQHYRDLVRLVLGEI